MAGPSRGLLPFATLEETTNRALKVPDVASEMKIIHVHIHCLGTLVGEAINIITYITPPCRLELTTLKRHRYNDE